MRFARPAAKRFEAGTNAWILSRSGAASNISRAASLNCSEFDFPHKRFETRMCAVTQVGEFHSKPITPPMRPFSHMPKVFPFW